MDLLSLIKNPLKRLVLSSNTLRPFYNRYLDFRHNFPFYFKRRNWIYCYLYFPKPSQEDRYLKKIVQQEKINLLLDVGAHAGETGWVFRERVGYVGRIVSFEPLSERFSILQERAKLDPPWECQQIALGEKNEIKTFNVFNNLYTSSFLKVDGALEKECKLQKIREEAIQIRRLEDLFSSLCKETDSILLKIDTQGFEKQVLEGLGKYLSQIRLVKLELSCVPLYEGETLMGEMILYMKSKGFVPILIQPGHVSENSHHLQADLLFLNNK